MILKKNAKTIIRIILLVISAALVGVSVYSINAAALNGNQLPMPFGFGLTYADVTEEWITPTRVKLCNNGGMDTDYAVLRYTDETRRELCDFKKVHIKVGESVTVDF